MDRIRASVQRLHPYVPGAQPTDPRVIKLNTNENPYPPSPQVEAVLRDFAVEGLRKYPDPVCRELREAIGEVHDWNPDHVIVGNGSDELLALCMRAFCEPERGAIAFFDPSYSLYPVLASIEDLPVVRVPLSAGFGWVDPGPDAGSVFFLTHPNAPTGQCYDPAALEAFIASYPGVVVLDEAYADFAAWNGVELARKYDHVLITRTLSKSYGLASIRCGYALGSAALVEALYKIKDSYNVNGLTQAVATAAMRDREWFAKTVSAIKATRDRVAGALRERGCELSESHGNFLWVKTKQPAAEVFDHLQAHHIYIRYFPGERTGDWLRISIGTDDEMERMLSVWPE